VSPKQAALVENCGLTVIYDRLGEYDAVKDALIGVIEGVCGEYHLRHFACRGNVSQSELYAAGKRFPPASDSNQAATPVLATSQNAFAPYY
jgi:hypothetical protein